MAAAAAVVSHYSCASNLILDVGTL